MAFNVGHPVLVRIKVDNQIISVAFITPFHLLILEVFLLVVKDFRVIEPSRVRQGYRPRVRIDLTIFNIRRHATCVMVETFSFKLV